MGRASVIFWVFAVLVGATIPAVSAPNEGTADSTAPSSRSMSASPRAPASGLAYGPRAMAGVGSELHILPSGEGPWSLGVAGLAAFDNAWGRGLVPGDLWRANAEIGATRAWPSGPVLGFDGSIEATVALGWSGAGVFDEGPESPQLDGIPFGGGGWPTRLELAAVHRFGRGTVVTRVGERLFLNGLVARFGAKAASDIVANSLGEGLEYAPYADVALRWRHRPSISTLVSLFAERMVPADDSARPASSVRLLVGLGASTQAVEFVPYVSVDLGAGPGVLINRRELRLSGGLRVVPF